MHRGLRLRAVAAVALATLLVSGSALAATIVGTPKNDTLRGTAKADKLYGRGGNDMLLGRGGNDALTGGPGNDTLVGGPGNDKLQCGPGRDVVQAAAGDLVSADCEVVQGAVLPSLSVGDASVSEGDSGKTALSVPVTLSAPVTWTASVAYSTSNGSATAPGDYDSATGTLTFAPGETSKTIAVAVNGDTAIEPDETLSVNLSGPVNATIADGSGSATIKNEDRPRPRSGHYQGTTSQNRKVQFDVSADSASLTHLSIVVDVQCDYGFKLTDAGLDAGDTVIALKPDWSFDFSGTDYFSDGSLTYLIKGSVLPSGSAQGTGRFDWILKDPGYPDIRCTTENFTWSAS